MQADHGHQQPGKIQRRSQTQRIDAPMDMAGSRLSQPDRRPHGWGTNLHTPSIHPAGCWGIAASRHLAFQLAGISDRPAGRRYEWSEEYRNALDEQPPLVRHDLDGNEVSPGQAVPLD